MVLINKAVFECIYLYIYIYIHTYLFISEYCPSVDVGLYVLYLMQRVGLPLWGKTHREEPLLTPKKRLLEDSQDLKRRWLLEGIIPESQASVVFSCMFL